MKPLNQMTLEELTEAIIKNPAEYVRALALNEYTNRIKGDVIEVEIVGETAVASDDIGFVWD